MQGKPNVALPGAVVVVTGANRGIGRALALAFAREGARLVVHARTEAKLRGVVEAARAAGAQDVRGVAGELLEADLGERLAAAADTLGGYDLLLLNAAALGPMAPLRETSQEVFSQVMRLNVDAQLPLIQAALGRMVPNGRGMIIGMSSGLGRFGVPRFGVYCASKHGLEGLIKVVAEEHGPDGVVAVAMAPGMVQTEMLKQAMLGADVSEHQTPEDTAAGFVRFVTSTSSEVNGASLDIGEWLLR